jgi:fatty acid desaturase
VCSAVAIIGIALSLYAVTRTDNAFFQFFNAVFFAFFSVQLGMIGHDLSHGAVFTSATANRVCASLAWGFFGGLSETRWFEKHNRHHIQPNHIGFDPDVGIPFMFTDLQVEAKSDFLRRWMLPYQHIIFWPALAFVYPWNIMLSVRHYLDELSWYVFGELILVVIHFAILFTIVFGFLPVPVALLFLTTAFAAIGVYMGIVFAPNHKGRPELSKDDAFTWVHQILLTRDLFPSWVTFYVCGGLNFQIEHHLFPTMSRLKYWEAHKIVKHFCEAHGIEHHETSWAGSVKEMYDALAKEAQAARPARAPALR